MNNSLDETEIRIIESTLKTLRENGLASTTTVKIAKNAEVSEVTLFRKFKSKDNIIKVTNDYYLDFLLKEFDDVFKYDDNKEFDVLLKEIWWDIQNIFDKNIDIIKVAFDGFHTLNENKLINIASNEIITKLTEIFKIAISNKKIRNINPSIAALTIFNMIFQTTLYKRIQGSNKIPTIDENINVFFDIFFNGIVI